MHHQSAGKYYKINLVIFALFFGASFYATKHSPEVFFNSKWVTRLYMGTLTASFIAMYFFSNRQVKNLYLLSCGKKIAIETYSNFGFTINRLREIPIEQLAGNRLFLKREMNLY